MQPLSKKVPTSPHELPDVIADALLTWYSKSARDLPWRRTRDPYAIWISEIMLQQTQVNTVIPYWQRWMERLPDLQSLARAPRPTVLKLWEGLGYYTRAHHLAQAAQLILKHHHGSFPETYESLLELPGIGPYTAGAICSIAFGQPTPILDGNVMRVLTRLFGISSSTRLGITRRRLWKLSEELVLAATAFKSSFPLPCSLFNQALMELGATVCTPRTPQCKTCPVNTVCVAFRTDRTSRYPNLPKRPKTIRRQFIAFVAVRGKTIAIRQRPKGVVNAHLWEFPSIEVDRSGFPIEQAAMKCLGETPTRLQHLCTIEHSITKSRIRLDAYRGEFGLSLDGGDLVWRARKSLQALPFTGAHRKIIEVIAEKGFK